MLQQGHYLHIYREKRTLRNDQGMRTAISVVKILALVENTSKRRQGIDSAHCHFSNFFRSFQHQYH